MLLTENFCLSLESLSKPVAFERWLDDSWNSEQCGDVQVYVTNVIPQMLSCLRRIAPANESLKLRERFAMIIRFTCKTFGLLHPQPPSRLAIGV